MTGPAKSLFVLTLSARFINLDIMYLAKFIQYRERLIKAQSARPFPITTNRCNHDGFTVTGELIEACENNIQFTPHSRVVRNCWIIICGSG